jgi:Ca2+-binding EF-hand superfamily protein
MGSISGVNGMSNAWAQVTPPRSQAQDKLFSQVDADSSGSVDKAELNSMLSNIGQTTVSRQNSDQLFTAMDGNNDGNLSSDELASGLEGLMTAANSTVDFASQRSEQTDADNLLFKVDTNANGEVDKIEMQAYTNKMQAETGLGSPTSFGELDTNNDGTLSATEFRSGEASGPPPIDQPAPPINASSTRAANDADSLDSNNDDALAQLDDLTNALNEFVSVAHSEAVTAQPDDDIVTLATLEYQQVSDGGGLISSGSVLSARV